MPLRTIPLRRSLLRPSLLMDCERELVLMSGMMCGVLVFTSNNIVIALGAGALWFVSVVVFRQMAKSDPVLSKVYLRHIRYRRFYPARSTPWRVDQK